MGWGGGVKGKSDDVILYDVFFILKVSLRYIVHIDFSRLWRRGKGIKILISLTKIQEKAGAELCQADSVVVLVVVGVIFISNPTQRKNLYWEGVHRTYFLDRGNYWDGEITYTGRGAPNIICCCWGGGTILEGTPRNNGKKQSGGGGWSIIL